jgi:glucosamine 6-phosphate synthetase-like amidotransferase/phosphosugar isomerase protein
MCGQCGIILAEGKRDEKQLSRLRSIFTKLLFLNELRGKDATGIATIGNYGKYHLMKRSVAASSFIRQPKFHEVLESLSDTTTLVMGHTRLATVGSVKNITNGHPIKSGCCLATANGTIFNADELFRKFRLRRFAEVDSELIPRLAERHTDNGEIAVEDFLHSLRHCRGQISAVVTSVSGPQRIIVLKGNRPLSLRYHPELGALVYSSDGFHLGSILKTKSWKRIDLMPMTCAVFNIADLLKPQVIPFNFIKEPWSKNHD